jgi:hypothetical protein
MRKVARGSRAREQAAEHLSGAKRSIAGVVRKAGLVVAALVGAVGLMLLLALAVNTGARWLAERAAEKERSPEVLAEKARDNLLIVGVGGASGADFLALRLDEENGQIFGIAVPSGAFMEVPGQGFERIGDSYAAGPDVSLAAISNYLSVPFEHYVEVDHDAYQEALTGQSLKGIAAAMTDTDLDEAEVTRVGGFLDGVPTSKVALVPLPVRPISLGSQTFFEPQRDEIADLLLQWWGVKLGAEQSVTRAIVYNGSGQPGIAGQAAQQLIRSGVKIVETANADRFDYTETLIVVHDGDMSAGESVRVILGVGSVVSQPSDQDVADVIVIVGKDYVPPADGGTTP